MRLLDRLNSPPYTLDQARLEQINRLTDEQVAQPVALLGGGASPYAHGPPTEGIGRQGFGQALSAYWAGAADQHELEHRWAPHRWAPVSRLRGLAARPCVNQRSGFGSSRHAASSVHS